MEGGADERYSWIVEDAGDEDADLVEEREELASAHDLCAALRWHHDFIAWCAGGAYDVNASEI